MIFERIDGRWSRLGLHWLGRRSDLAAGLRKPFVRPALGPWLDRGRGVSFPPHGRPKQLVVFLHGVNGCGDAWMWLADVWRKYLPDAAFVFPDGIERVSPGAFRWWNLHSFDRRELRAGVRRATPRFQQFLEQIQDALGIAPEATIVGGFSQGAMLALHVGERSRPALAGILAYGGMAAGLPQDRAGVRSAPPIFLYHGTHDQIVPFSAFGSTNAQLRQLGFEVVEYAAQGVDHTIDLQGAECAGALMQRWLHDGEQAAVPDRAAPDSGERP